jgi:hypothetical protein
MLSFRFHLDVVPLEERQDWVELLHRTSGITFLWTNRRWEQDFLIFVVREHFARVYAFSAQRFEASARITLDTLDKLLNWFEKHWLVEDAKPAVPSSAPDAPSPDEALSSASAAPPEEEAEDSGASFEW